jgi:hypothetical protein
MEFDPEVSLPFTVIESAFAADIVQREEGDGWQGRHQHRWRVEFPVEPRDDFPMPLSSQRMQNSTPQQAVYPVEAFLKPSAQEQLQIGMACLISVRVGLLFNGTNNNLAQVDVPGLIRTFVSTALMLLCLNVGAETMAAGSDLASTPPLLFEDYPAKLLLPNSRLAAKVTLATAQARRYRTVISEGGMQSVNFAGHFRLVTWGCGTDCRSFAIVDRTTGIARTPDAIQCITGAMGNDQDRLDFRPDSSLLVVNGFINEEEEGSFFYEWTGSELKLLRRLPLVKESIETE